MAEEQGAGLKKLKALFIDCGSFDQYNLLYGARRLHRQLEQRGIPHVYEEFRDDHSSVDYRLDKSLPLLTRALV
jgi:enterochelin esterase-like enzyme